MEKRYEKVLIIDDNEEILVALKIFLRNHFQEIQTLNSPSNIHTTISQNDFDLILLDMNFKAGDRSGNEGVFWLREILKLNPEAIIICITAYGDIQLAVKAMQNGAIDFIEKPWNEEHLLASILRAAKLNNTKKQLVKLSQTNKQLARHSSANTDFVQGHSSKMQQVWQTVHKIAPTDANVLITGENGTGKEICAKNIHSQSLRKDAPFIAVDLGALSSSIFESELFGHVQGAFTSAKTDKVGWFEVANGGTLFLDEVANLSVEQQAKLLTVIQNKEVSKVGSTASIPLDIRIISATNANLNSLVAEGKFREDLMYRLNTIHIHLPPLKEVKEDIVPLVQYYFNKFSVKYHKTKLKLPESAMKRLQHYHWPGNIRELKHTIERAVIMSESEKLTVTDLYNETPEHINSEVSSTTNLNLEENELNLIKKAINSSKGNYTKASQLLGVSRRTLYNKLEKYDL